MPTGDGEDDNNNPTDEEDSPINASIEMPNLMSLSPMTVPEEWPQVVYIK